MLGAALAEYRRVNDHRRSTGYLAGARQAILEGMTAALTESIEASCVEVRHQVIWPTHWQN